jgi:hypothetical protein
MHAWADITIGNARCLPGVGDCAALICCIPHQQPWHALLAKKYRFPYIDTLQTNPAGENNQCLVFKAA